MLVTTSMVAVMQILAVRDSELREKGARRVLLLCLFMVVSLVLRRCG